MSPSQSLIESFSRLVAAKEGVRLINDHRGIPVSNMATVEGLKDRAVVFKVNKHQCVCLELDRFTYIQSPALPSILKARVADLDIINTRVTLSNFEPAPETIGQRTLVRVQPKDPLAVLITFQGQKIRGTLVDISTNGIGLFMVSAFTPDPGFLRKNERIVMTFRLPNETGSDNEIRIHGSILYVNREKGSYRLGVTTNPEPHSQKLISQYIAQRQAEIMGELKTLYDRFYRIKLAAK